MYVTVMSSPVSYSSKAVESRSSEIHYPAIVYITCIIGHLTYFSYVSKSMDSDTIYASDISPLQFDSDSAESRNIPGSLNSQISQPAQISESVPASN